MADGRTFTEGEAYALVADNVARETAEAKERNTTLTAENTGLQNRIDVLDTEKAAETVRADLAEKAFTEFKTNLEAETAREAKRTERTAQVAEAAPGLEMTDERATRIVAMEDEIFASYLTDLREVAAKAKVKLDKNGKPVMDPKTGKAMMADNKMPMEPDEDDKTDGTRNKASEGDIPRESAAFGGTTTSTKASVRGLIGAGRAMAQKIA